jgi:PAS domain S-box-containing protein
MLTFALTFDGPESTAELVAVYRNGAAQLDSDHALLRETAPLYQHLAGTKEPLLVADVPSDRRLAPLHSWLSGEQVRSVFLLALRVDQEVIGAIGLGAAQVHDFSAQDIRYAWSILEPLAGVLAQARLSEERQQLSAAIAQADVAVIITDAECKITYVNLAFERMSGYSRAEAVGQSPRLLRSDQHPPSFYEEVWDAAINNGGWQGRLTNRAKDGSLYTVNAGVVPIHDNKGTLISCISVQRDITRELELEQEYRQSLKMEALGRMAAGVAHDFNNLLTAINGFAMLAQEDLAPDVPAQDSLAMVIKAGQSAAELVTQLLAFSRKKVSQPQTVDLAEMISGTSRMLTRIIGEHIELRTACSPEIWPVLADPADLQRVLVNLAVNARDAMPEGGALSIEAKNVLLARDNGADAIGIEPGPYIALSVRDTGTGISDEVLEHLFEPFFTTKREGKGTGLGLACVHGIVEQLGGAIRVCSELGQGTTFEIYMPRAEHIEPPVTLASEQTEISGRGETVLVVEDDPSVLELTTRVLAPRGYHLLQAQDGGEARQLAQAYSDEIDLLLTDAVLPGITGRALADQLTRERPQLKVLFMSGYADGALGTQGMLEPGIEFLAKPFQPGELAAKVRAVLEKAPQRAAS